MAYVKYVDIFVIAGHDRMLRQFDINGKSIREVKGTDDEVAHTGKIQKVAVDASGSYALSVCSDKYVYLSDLRAGTCLAVLCGFGAPPTDATFSDDFKSVLVTTANGAIFIWQLAKNVTDRMISAQVRLMEEVTMRTATPDSLLGSGSETISGDSNSFGKPLGAPEFSGSSASLYSEDDDDDSTRFSSSVRSSRTKRTLGAASGGHPIGTSSYARVGDRYVFLFHRFTFESFLHPHHTWNLFFK
uniref:WD_REPEATS_REGION domain-containing protein n=1 Tax=Caenorhabditis japonica TaxID=281687 RepID=A0A8R1IN39_CAEJA